MDDAKLVERLRERDPNALNLFYEQYRDRIFAVTRRIVRDDWDAEEVVQDVVWTVYRKIELFNGDSAFWSWVYRVSENAAKMHVRKYKRYPTPVEGDVLQAISNKSDDKVKPSRPDEEYNCQRAMEELRRYLNESDEVNRDIYVYMDMVGMAKEEVAEKLDLSIPALKARLHRVRYGLKRHLLETCAL